MRRIILASTVLSCCLAAAVGAQVPEHSFSLARFGDTPNHSYPYRIEVTKDSSFEALSYTLVYRVDQGPELRVEGNPDSLADGSAVLEIPSQPSGSLVQYYLEFRDKYGIAQFLPDSAPQVKNSFRITEPPNGPEHLLLTSAGDGVQLYDLSDQREVGRIYGLSWRKAAWSPDGSLAVLYGFNDETLWIHVLDITNFRLLRTVVPGFRMNGYSRPLIEAGNRWAFFQDRWKLYRLDLQSGEISPVPGLSDGAYLSDEPLVLPGENKFVVCASVTPGNGKYQNFIYYLDPASGTFTTFAVMPAPGMAAQAFQVDMERRKFFLFNGNTVRALQGGSYVTLLERKYRWPTQTPWGEWSLQYTPETMEYISTKGVVVFQAPLFSNYTD